MSNSFLILIKSSKVLLTSNFYLKYWDDKNGLYALICSCNNISGSLYKKIPAGFVNFFEDNRSSIN